MKKTKVFLSFICVILIMTSFTSCLKLDDAKNMQAFWDENQSNTILYNGKTYKKLDDNFSSRLSNFITTNTDKKVYITKKDVPVLLSRYFSSTAFLSLKNEYIDMHNDLFVSEEYFDTVKDILNKSDFSSFGSGYYNEDDQSYNFVVFPENISKIINKAISDESNFSDDNGEFLFYSKAIYLSFFPCDSYGLFYKGQALNMYGDKNEFIITFQREVIKENQENTKTDEKYIDKDIAIEDSDYFYEDSGYEYESVFVKIQDKEDVKTLYDFIMNDQAINRK